MLVGTHEHSLDGKNRLVLPRAFRDHFARGGYIAPHQNSIGLWSAQEFEFFVARLTERVRTGEASQDAKRALLAATVDFTPDSQGRVVIKELHRAHARLEREVVLIGNDDHVEVWDVSTWRDRSPVATADLTKVVADLGI